MILSSKKKGGLIRSRVMQVLEERIDNAEKETAAQHAALDTQFHKKVDDLYVELEKDKQSVIEKFVVSIVG